MANLEMETVNQLLNSVMPDSAAYKGLKKLQGKLQKYWGSSEVAIQEFIVDKYFEEIAEALVKKGVTDMAKLFDPLSGIDVGRCTYSRKTVLFTYQQTNKACRL